MWREASNRIQHYEELMQFAAAEGRRGNPACGKGYLARCIKGFGRKQASKQRSNVEASKGKGKIDWPSQIELISYLASKSERERFGML